MYFSHGNKVDIIINFKRPLIFMHFEIAFSLLRSRGMPGHEYIHKAKILVGVLL